VCGQGEAAGISRRREVLLAALHGEESRAWKPEEVHPAHCATLPRARSPRILVITYMNAETRPDQIETVCQKLRTLSVETRLRILALLAKRNLCVGALACQLGVTQGAVSQHLKILRDAGLVTAERDGYYVHYRVERQALAEWQGALDELLERLQQDRTHGAVAEDAAAADCKGQEEDTCARRKTRADAEKRAT